MKKCDCGSGKTYEQCCEPYHLGTKVPETPEALMRSRYSAYALANIDYIQATMRGKASLGFDPVTAKLWAERVIWIKLQVLAATQLSPTQGEVEFIASFVDNKTLCQMHEISGFHYSEGRWFYMDGKPPLVSTVKTTNTPISRNTPCPCGSQKKWKYCHGNA